VPLTIQNYDAASIRALFPRTVRDVLAFDPSVLTSNYGGGFDNFGLRGFSMDNFNTIRSDGLALYHDMLNCVGMQRGQSCQKGVIILLMSDEF